MAAKLREVSFIVGPWQGQVAEIDSRQFTVTRGIAAIARRYTNGRTGESIDVMILYGRPGPVSEHTPDVCYVGAGYDPRTSPVHCDVPLTQSGPSAEFWTGVYVKRRSKSQEALRILWTWSGDGKWTAPERPKVTFAPQGTIFKLYVIRAMVDEDEPIDTDPSKDFIRAFIPELNRTLFGSPTR
jgi:hypothetical protein